MTIERRAGTIALSGDCGVEEVETLLEHLERAPDLAIDVSGATSIHTSLWQALMVYRTRLVGAPSSNVTTNLVFSAVSHYISQAGKA